MAAKRALTNLTGTRRSELGAVLSNVQAIAAAGQLSASRLAVTFLTLERNLQWWTTEPLLGGSQRITFPESEIVWEHYPGQGIEIQWLGDLRRGQRALLGATKTRDLRQLLSRSDPARQPARRAGSRGSTCSTSTMAARRRGRAGSRRAPRMQLLARA